MIGIGMAGTLLGLSGPSAADCPAPVIHLSRPTARPGQNLAIDSIGYRGCDDTGGGCLGALEPEESTEPYRNIDIELRRRGNVHGRLLATVDANPEGMFEIDVEIPKVRPGKYLITAEISRAPLQIRK